MSIPAGLALGPTLDQIGLSIDATVPSLFEFHLDEFVYYTTLADDIHLNGAAIALGLSNVAYEPN